MTKVTITLQDGEFIARHLDHVGIIGVGDTEQEALQELAEALGVLAFRVNKKDELLGLYIKYSKGLVSGKLCIQQLHDLQLKIKQLEKELGGNKVSNQDALNNLAILSEILVDVSKSHITPSEAIEDIRKLDISSIYKVMSKQTELLGLYRKTFTKNISNTNYEEWIILESQIKTLEEELK